MNKMIRTAGPVSVCVAVILSSAGCGPKQGPPPRPPMAVKTTAAVKVDVPVVIKAFGNTEDRESVDIVPQVSGILVKALIQDGAVVTNGQPLFLIDSSDYSARVRQLEGVVSADRANLQLARNTAERNRPLFEKKLISEGDFDAITTKVSAAAALLQVDEANLDLAKLSLARCTITSPLNGICSKRYVDEGNLVAAGMTRLTNIRSYDPIDLEFSVSEQYLPVLRKSMADGVVPLEILAQGDTNSVKGVLKFIDNAVNLQGGTVLLRGVAANSDVKLWAKQFVNINVLAGIVRDAVMVPEGAVQFGKNGPYLFVVNQESKVDLRQVRTGVRYGDAIQITSGADAGERVVVLGQLMLAPGADVAEAGQTPPSAHTGTATNAVPASVAK